MLLKTRVPKLSLMKANLKLPTIVSEERNNFRKIPVSINFEIPYFTVSGI